MKTTKLINWLEDEVCHHESIAAITETEKRTEQWPLVAKHHKAKAEAYRTTLGMILSGEFGAIPGQ